jgi:uncharacterized protein YbbC (DUF1343 family)
MTVGELSAMANGEGWLANGARATLTVVRMEGWRRGMWYDETGLRWVKPSPNMATLRTATVYPGTCLIEGTNLSEGRGTEHPFEWIGAPFMDGPGWAVRLNGAGLAGVRFRPITFTPVEIPGVASHPKYEGRLCNGVAVDVVDRDRFEPVRTVLTMLATVRAAASDSFQWRGSIDRLSGTGEVRRGLDSGASIDELIGSWKPELASFMRSRERYLLYE